MKYGKQQTCNYILYKPFSLVISPVNNALIPSGIITANAVPTRSPAPNIETNCNLSYGKHIVYKLQDTMNSDIPIIYIHNFIYIKYYLLLYLTSDKFITNGSDPATQDPTNITRESIHSIALSSIFI